MIEPDRALYREAGLLPGHQLRSVDQLRDVDALHLAAALRVGADQMVSYDKRQAEAARRVGLPVLAP